MATEITIFIDKREIRTQEGLTILQAADAAGIYIPRLCYHADLSPGPGTMADSRVYRHGEIGGDKNDEYASYHGCNVCIVDVEGKGSVPSCVTPVEDGMIIHSETPAIKELRMDHLAGIVSLHPHACLLCSENTGCDRETCPQGEVKQGRCCSKFGDCEFQKVCEYVEIKENVSQYLFRDIPVIDTPFFTLDANLCIGCTRCIRACEKLQGKRVMGFTFHEGEFVVGTTGPSHRESGCVFCGACVMVCPTGALMEKKVAWKKKEQLVFTPVILPPEENIDFTDANIDSVPEENGVYQLLDEKQEIIYIKGTDNLRKDLQEKVQSVAKARFFRYEEHGMYTMRENEMVEKYLKKYGSLPEVNNEISDLY